MIDLSSDVKYIKGVGPQRAELLKKLDINNVGDLLHYFPRAYIDFSKSIMLKDAEIGKVVCIQAFTDSVRTEYIRKGMTLYKVTASDGDSLLEITFFNNNAITYLIKEGYEYYFLGKIEKQGRIYKMNSPKFISCGNNTTLCNPVYPLTAGLTSSNISKFVMNAYNSINEFDDSIPEQIRNDYCLMSAKDSIYNLHFPQSEDLLSEAKRRQSFEELLVLQLGMARLKLKSRKPSSHILLKDYSEEFLGFLPFCFTEAQKRVVKECISDMMSSHPMNRLVQGDVGSGKTVVAACCIYSCIKNGYQCALMAPTEVLAQQHFNSFSDFFRNTDIKFEIITGSTKQSVKKDIKSKLKNGEIDLIIGTHALIQDDVSFKDLGLTITDEQHRFGVNQRNSLISKGENAHTLVMSATPIPRTLSLIIYGDLDISIIDELPKGRQKIDTFLISDDKRERAYGYVKKHLLEGRQGYIVCPLVEDDPENPDFEKKAAKELFKDLNDGFFKGFSVGLLYGKMKPSDKAKVMNDFNSGKTQLLISTTVIEVGVDVPNAVIMLIENADMFGLSQLHQLRGRIGRGNYKSTCILVSGNNSTDVIDRLNVIVSCDDGFKIADEDLKLRGPGDFFGQRQHGLPEMKVANMMSDGELIRETKICVDKLLKNNPTLEGEEYKLLKIRVNEFFRDGISLN